MPDDSEAILVEIIRKWYATICYELALPIRITSVQAQTPYGHGYVLGQYDRNGRSITMYVLPQEVFGRLRGNYLLTLAHELRHAWQHKYDVPPTEGDENDWAQEDFLRRYASGPTAGRYGGPIIGSIYPCPSCRRPIRFGNLCGECILARESEAASQQRRVYESRVQEAETRKAKAHRKMIAVKDRVSLILTTLLKTVEEFRHRREGARKKAIFDRRFPRPPKNSHFHSNYR